MVYLSVLGLSFGWVRITSKLKALNWGSKRSRTCNIAACIGVFYCNSYFTNSETGAKLASLMANVLNYEMALAQNAKESRPGEFQRCLLRTTLQFSLHEEDILKYKGYYYIRRREFAPQGNINQQLTKTATTTSIPSKPTPSICQREFLNGCSIIFTGRVGGKERERLASGWLSNQ